ncbi:hypothetical protein [Bacillus cereus]|uniref:hypothetical protein n=1 Tax=Bacillus cereus TaxID=1396 RepID=UPI0014827CB1|nr:hypothetical protein [Bacillus cereus]
MCLEKTVFIKPEYFNVKIWRYIDFNKFIDILERNSLYFTRSDKFDDPFEGISQTVTKGERLRCFNDMYNRLDSERKDAIQQSAKDLDWKIREWTYINCWHMNESDAMWKLYFKSDVEIAIQSTFNHLCNSFSNVEEGICIGKVNYIDYEIDGMHNNRHILSPFVYKRKEFAHERELRAVMMKFPHYETVHDYNRKSFDCGVHVRVNLEELIDTIYIAPTAPAWTVELVKLMLIKYELGHKKVLQSSLIEKPSF